MPACPTCQLRCCCARACCASPPAVMLAIAPAAAAWVLRYSDVTPPSCLPRRPPPLPPSPGPLGGRRPPLSENLFPWPPAVVSRSCSCSTHTWRATACSALSPEAAVALPLPAPPPLPRAFATSETTMSAAHSCSAATVQQNGQGRLGFRHRFTPIAARCATN